MGMARRWPLGAVSGCEKVTANKIIVHRAIRQSGPLGYLLWLRQAMPIAYVTAARRVPALGAFELGLRQASGIGCCGLGQDFSDVTDLADETSSISDVSSFADSYSGSADTGPITVDYGSTIDASVVDQLPVTTNFSPELDASVVDPGNVPDLPPIQAPAAASPAASAASSSSMASSLPAIAKIVGAVAGVTVAALNHSTAAINASTVAKTQGAAALQLQQALQGNSPYLTGTVQGADGNYIAAVTPSVLSSTIGGIPLWALLAAGGAGAILLLTN